jgi:hypothetical protein
MVLVSATFKPADRPAWRQWLEANHALQREIWLVTNTPADRAALSYLDAVEEALCFGWVDGLAKRLSPTESAQRFTPRRAKSHWTELNKQRVRRLIRLGLMTPMGLDRLPDLSAPFVVAADIEAALRAASPAWANLQACPALYVRVRVGYVEEMRGRPAEFHKRLANLVAKSVMATQFGNWNDKGRLLDVD